MNSLKTYWFRGMVFCCLLFTLLLGQRAVAQTNTISRPSIGGHVFTPVTYSKTPFTNTYFSILTGFGQTTNLVHQLDSIGNYQPRGLSGEVTFINMSFTYNQQVREWLAAYITFSLSTRVGTELQSLLAQGINTLTSFEIGWNIKLIEREKFTFSTAIELHNSEGSFISISKYFQELFNNNPDPSMKETIPVLTFGTGFRFAYGLSDLIGFRASADLAYGESYTRGENSFTYGADGGIDIDFCPRYSLPLGMMLHYSISTLPNLVYVEDGRVQITKAKLAYTRSTEFSLGVEYAYVKIPLPNLDKNTSLNSLSLTIRFYF